VKNPSAEQLKSLQRWRLSTFWVMLIGYVGYYLVRGNLPVALPLLSQEFGYSNTELGYILTVSELFYAIGKFTTGPLADQVGGRKVFLLGMVAAVFFNLIFPLYPSLWYFVAVWSAARFFLSMGWGGLVKIIGAWYEPERNGVIMGFISINFQFGGSFAALFAGALIAEGVGWRGLFYWPALVVSVIAVWAFFASKESPQDVVPNVRFGGNAGDSARRGELRLREDHRAWDVVLSLWSLPMFRRLLVYSFLIHILRSFFMYWIPKFMVDLGLGNFAAAMSSAVFPLAGCLGTVALGWYTDHYAPPGQRTGAMWKMLLVSAFAIAAIAYLVNFHTTYAGLIVVLLAVAGFCIYGPYSMTAGALTLDIAGPEGAGTCSGMLDGVGYIGGTVASLGTGVVADHFGWSQTFWVLSVFALGTAVGTAFLFRATAQQRARR
jgi:sugar phosphate permease